MNMAFRLFLITTGIRTVAFFRMDMAFFAVVKDTDIGTIAFLCMGMALCLFQAAGNGFCLLMAFRCMLMTFFGIFTDQLALDHGTAGIGMLMAFRFLNAANQLLAIFRMLMRLCLALFLSADEFPAILRMLMRRRLFFPAHQDHLLLKAAFLMYMGQHFFQLTDQLSVFVIAVFVMRMDYIIRISADWLFPVNSTFSICRCRDNAAFIAFCRMNMYFLSTGKHFFLMTQSLPVHLQCGSGSRCNRNRKAEENRQPAPVFFLLTQQLCSLFLQSFHCAVSFLLFTH
ncbi:MAG: hypothetical protein HFH84_01885 [Lachnospiraceae bacterium]|nr:hypothetical protein [Lachnospiraceae bacterium]